MLSKREAFKVAFLRRCAVAGLTPGETHQAVKSALAVLEEPVEKRALGVWPWLQKNIPGLETASSLTSDLTRSMASKLLNLGLLSTVGLPIAGGGLVGYGLAKAKGVHDPEPDEIKAKETRDFYQRATARALAKTKQKRKRRPIRRTPRMLV